MAHQVAVRISDDELAHLDAAIAQGRYPSRYAAVAEAVRRLVRDDREAMIEDAYRRAYAADMPSDERIAEAGAELLAEIVLRDRAAGGRGDL